MRYSKQRFIDGEEQFARAAYDVLQDLEMEYGATVGISITRTQRKGVFYVDLMFAQRNVTSDGPRGTSIREEWPNPRVASLGAHLFSMATRTARWVGELGIKRPEWPPSPPE